jgi:two-component system sensor histidine kinase PhoQ
LNREKHQRERYRNAMDDLAHSLKTPLAVLKGFSSDQPLSLVEARTLREQVDRMDQIVSYQLQKATSGGGGEIIRPIEIVSLTGKLLSALEKVYRNKSVKLEVNLVKEIYLRMDEGDFLEVAGNLLDNAFKYGKNRVSVNSRSLGHGEMLIEIEDNGKGLNEVEIENILNRGMRLDQTYEGQGIGLAVVADIVKTYNIEMTFGRSGFGGLKVGLIFQTAE